MTHYVHDIGANYGQIKEDLEYSINSKSDSPSCLSYLQICKYDFRVGTDDEYKIFIQDMFDSCNIIRKIPYRLNYNDRSR